MRPRRLQVVPVRLGTAAPRALRLRSVAVRVVALCAVALSSVALGGCSSASPGGTAGPPLPARWARFLHLPGVVDLAGPRADGSFTVAAAGRLFRLTRGGVLSPFARGRDGYSTANGPESYIALAAGEPGAGGRCAFRRDTVFAIEPSTHPGVIEINPQGVARRFTDLPRNVMPNGIAFDTVGRFQHRLLVTARGRGGTTLFGIDCTAAVSVITSSGPAVEGGIAVAPLSFGRFGGDLIAPNETSGRIFVFQPDGSAATLVRSGLASGGDIGVESAGFVPPGFGAAGAVYMADRFSSGNAHPGTNSILELPGAQLVRAGVQPGDLLVASEGGAQTIVVRCTDTCAVRHIANGPAASHGEGHVVLAMPAL